jgi:hypothetical protein
MNGMKRMAAGLLAVVALSTGGLFAIGPGTVHAATTNTNKCTHTSSTSTPTGQANGKSNTASSVFFLCG